MGEIFNLVASSKMGDENSTLIIVEKFSPLLNKYCRKLKYDGSKTDLIISLLETLRNMPIYRNNEFKNDGCIVGYVNTSIRHKYIALSKKNCLIVNRETILNANIVGENYSSGLDDKLFVYELLDRLTGFQKQIIKNIYINNISESDLARQMHVSRQAINKTKKRALNNLRKNFCK
jgi:RNA polymerase sigma factor (sigma-70 family)